MPGAAKPAKAAGNGRPIDTGMATATDEVDSLAIKLSKASASPVLVVFYDDSYGHIEDSDVRDIYQEFRSRGWTPSRPRKKVTVLLHTLGGNPDASYRVAQVIRDFASTVDYFVPEYAWSGGTLVALSADTILLGAFAALGPIDVTVGDGRNEIELASIEYYKRFAIECLHDTVRAMSRSEADHATEIESRLLCEMVDQVEAINIGALYRRSEITGRYARRLLIDYMFKSHPNRDRAAEILSNRLVKDFPSHGFALDFHMCRDLGLPISEASEEVSDVGKDIIEALADLTMRGVICRDVGNHRGRTYKAPFIRLYDDGRGS